jgi:DNA-binding beta-propeller fold protein YncE
MGPARNQYGRTILPRAWRTRGATFRQEHHCGPRAGFGRWPSTFLCFGRPGSGPGEFNRAEGLDIGLEDRIHVADSCNHRIQVFSRDGKWLKSFGVPGSGLGELSYPYDVRVDREGRQYVCEFGNSRIQVFDANSQPLEIIGGAGAKPGQFNNPWSIALDSRSNLYVADSANHRVQKFVRR